MLTRPFLEVSLNRFFGALLLLMLSPFLLVIALIILSVDGRPVLFVQKRLGLNGTPFLLYKFRTMKLHSDGKGEERSTGVTRLGRWLRTMSLDEFPQLWNVAKGEMNFVGPRPLLEEYRHLYSAEQFKRHAVRPGLTGLAQIRGRNSLTWEQKFELDLEYIRTKTLLGDLSILMKTVPVILLARNIGSEEKLWASRFLGSKQEN